MKKDLVSLSDYSADDISGLIDTAGDMKSNPDKYSSALQHKTLGMIFQKPSLRTRVSFEAGMTRMGGHAIFLNINDIQLGRGESIADTARVLSRYVDAIMARVFEYDDIVGLAQNATVPVINGLTNLNHPCQILSDMFTIYEIKKRLTGLKVAYLGDCNNNTCHSWLIAAPKMGINLTLGFPEGFDPKSSILSYSLKESQKNKTKFEKTHNPQEAVRGADVVYTDTWMSMHVSQQERDKRIKELELFQVTNDLMAEAKEDAIFMHCLPAYRGMEVSEEVIDGSQSVVVDQAENRMWMQNALLLKLIGNKK
ncbi:MAG: ornithine carbamoyltransferase [Candidatus Altiarchaeota archaeon]|nr:ornithine carbamoyltransferase [Candidatus Altiarchaeota archaeon]